MGDGGGARPDGDVPPSHFELTPNVFTRSPSMTMPDEPSGSSDATDRETRSAKGTASFFALPSTGERLMRQASSLSSGLARRLSWGYSPARTVKVKPGDLSSPGSSFSVQTTDASDEEAESATTATAANSSGRGSSHASMLEAIEPYLGERSFSSRDREAAFKHAWKDATRGATLRNLGGIAVGYAVVGALCVAAVAATDTALADASDPAASSRHPRGTLTAPSVTATEAAVTAALVAGGLVCLLATLLALAVSPRMTPARVEAVKAGGVTAAIGCVAIADALLDASRARLGVDHPGLCVAAVALLSCVPPCLMCSPAATAVSAALVVISHVVATLARAVATKDGTWILVRDSALPRACLLCVAAWLATLHAVHRRRRVRRHFTSMALLAKEEARADWVLELMLPPSIVGLLKSGSDHCAAAFKEASVLFVEIADFATLTASLSAADLVELLNFVFTVFDDAIEAHGSSVYKVETVGAVYVVCAGVPEPRPDHCKTLTVLALGLHARLAQALRARPDLPTVQCKMGLQSGPVVGGVIGIKHPRFRLFGDVVNTAARMETRGEPGRIHAAEAAATLLRDTGMFRLTDRGEMQVKGKGVMRTFFVEGFAADAVDAERLDRALAQIGDSRELGGFGGKKRGWAKARSAKAFLLIKRSVHVKREDLTNGMTRMNTSALNFDGWGDKGPSDDSDDDDEVWGDDKNDVEEGVLVEGGTRQDIEDGAAGEVRRLRCVSDPMRTPRQALETTGKSATFPFAGEAAISPEEAAAANCAAMYTEMSDFGMHTGRGSAASLVGSATSVKDLSTSSSSSPTSIGGGSDPMKQDEWTLRFAEVETERVYFASQWEVRVMVLRRAVPAGAVVAVATMLWTIRTPDAAGDDREGMEASPKGIPLRAWIAAGLTVLSAGGLILALLYTSRTKLHPRGGGSSNFSAVTVRAAKLLSGKSYRRLFGGISSSLVSLGTLVAQSGPSFESLGALGRSKPSVEGGQRLPGVGRLQPVIGGVIVALCVVYAWAGVDSASVRRPEPHVLILITEFAASFVFLTTSATAVLPTVVAVMVAHAMLILSRGTRGSTLLAPAAARGDGSGHGSDDWGDGGAFMDGGVTVLSGLEAAALIILTVCSGTLACAVSRAEERRSRSNFVKEFRRRREQRRWAALISNMLPPAVVQLLQKKEDSKKNLRIKGPDAAAEENPPTIAWSLPHTCIFQSDIVGFTSLTQRLDPKDVVSMLHSLFAAFDRVCAKHDVQKIETIGDAYLAATGCLGSVEDQLHLNRQGNRTPRDTVISGTTASARSSSSDGQSLGDSGRGRDESIGCVRSDSTWSDASVSAEISTNRGACRLARMALDIQALMDGYRAPDGSPLSMRAGLHYGETVGGVVGEKMLRYHLFGPPLEGVNRMEQTCEVGGVQCSEVFAMRLKACADPEEFVVQPAGEVEMEDGVMRPTYRLTFNPNHRRSMRRKSSKEGEATRRSSSGDINIDTRASAPNAPEAT